jgi:hypothetical protein
MFKISNTLSRSNQVGLTVLATLTSVTLLTIDISPAQAGGIEIQIGQPIYPGVTYDCPPNVIYPNSSIIYTNPPSSYIYNSGPNVNSYVYGSPIPNPVPSVQTTGIYGYQSPGYYYPGQVITPGIIVNPPVYAAPSYVYPGYSYGRFGGHSRTFIRY